MKGERIHVDYFHERSMNIVLITEENIKYNVKGSCRRKSTCGSLAVAPPKMSFRTITPST